MHRAPLFSFAGMLAAALFLLLPAAAAAQAVVTPQGWVTTGPVMTPAPPSPPLLTTPTMSFETVSPSPVGASAATAGNTAGATASTLAAPRTTPAAVRTQAVFAEPAPPPAPAVENGVPAPANGVAADEIEAQPFNAGLGRFAGAGPAGAVEERSLGELARQLAPHRTPQPGHVYTAADVERLEEYVAVRDQRFRVEEIPGPDALAAPPERTGDSQVDREETRLNIILEPEVPDVQPPDVQPDEAEPPLAARLQPQETAPPAPAAEPAADPQRQPAEPATLPTTASWLPLTFLLALFAAGAGLVYHLRR